MNLEEGFRRIVVAGYWTVPILGIILGIIAVWGTTNWFFALLVGFAVIIFFHIGVYVAKGFIKESGQDKDKE